MSKLPTKLMDTVSALCDKPCPVTSPYGELQIILLRSYGLRATQKKVRLLDHPSLGSNKCFVLMDQLIALKPDSMDDVIQALFNNKMRGYIRDMVNHGTRDLHSTNRFLTTNMALHARDCSH